MLEMIAKLRLDNLMTKEQMATLTKKTVGNIKRRYIDEKKVDTIQPFSDTSEKKHITLIICNNKLMEVLRGMDDGKYVKDAQKQFKFIIDEQPS